ncbi:MAG: hypothetical protein OEM38_06860, partial [Gammaproteobacteria bacterium]|nr:hypothetical protein [Gammaproteobacteria bacterium]
MKKLFVLYVSMFSMLISPLSYGEYSLTPVFKGKNTSGHYYEKNGMPHLFLDRKCKTVKKKQRCVDSLKNGEGDVFIKHSTDTHSITLRYLTRYQSKAFAWVTVSKHKEKGITSKFVIDSDNKRYSSNGPARNAYAVSITSDGVIVSVNEQGIYGVGGFLAAPEPLDKGEISINIGGEMAAVGIGASGSVLVSDTKQWSDTNVQLSERGDRVGVVAIFPDDRGENIYGAVYKY